MREQENAPRGAINLEAEANSEVDVLAPSFELGLVWQEVSDKKINEVRKRVVKKANMNPAKKRHVRVKQLA